MNNDSPTFGDFKIAIAWGLFAVCAIAVLGFALHALGVFGAIATAPGRVIGNTLRTDNIIASYEWFYDANGQFQSRVGQIKGHSVLLSGETDAKERSRLNIELAAISQSCRDLATRYNATAEKVNKAIFRSNDLPAALPVKACEV